MAGKSRKTKGQSFKERLPAIVEKESRPNNTRKIDGKVYRREPTTMIKNKANANAVANALRSRNNNARVIETKNGYSIYTRPKSKKQMETRSYNRHVAGHADIDSLLAKSVATRTSPSQPRRGIFSRLFLRPKNAVPSIGNLSRADELDLQEVEDYKGILKELEKSKTDLTRAERKDRAKLMAGEVRMQKEQSDKQSKARRQLETKERLEIERLNRLQWDDAVRTYNEPIPLGTLAKYNSLEIASTATTTSIGYGISTAFAVGSFPLVPISAGVGFVGAKIIRRNIGGIGLKSSVNKGIDGLEKVGKTMTHSVRVSKDNEEYPSKGTWWSLGLVRVPKKPSPADKLGLTKAQAKRFKKQSKKKNA
tara:strand:+ start:28204 stop:29298 length:1095 start_codon:yes stop_codon:yes gene_type:complete